MKQPGITNVSSLARLRAASIAVFSAATLGSVMVQSGYCQQQEALLTPGSRLLGQVRYTRISPPESGVKLLEEVFQRVRSTPQVALNTSNFLQQSQALAPKTHGPTDYRLAIRPKPTGKINALPSPAIQIMREGQAQSLAAALSGNGAAGSGVGFAGGALGGANEGSGGSSATVSLADSGAESWLGNKQYPVISSAMQPQHPNVWESKQSGDGMSAPAEESARDARQQAASPARSLRAKEQLESDEMTSMLGYRGNALSDKVAEKRRSVSAPQPQQVPDLASAAGKLLGALNGVDTLQRSQGGGRFDERQNAKADRGVSVTAYKNKASKREEIAWNVPTAAPPSFFANTPPAAPSVSASAKKSDRGRISKAQTQSADNDDEVVPAGNSYRRGAGAKDAVATRGKSNIAMSPSDIALLPPNVITGIQRINLGSSESQANIALRGMQLVNIKQQKVGKWTVTCLQNPHVKGSTALQLFVRNGLLDAMRIFDTTLFAPDFGVTMGDCLSKVKEKFGEPAFILHEPGPGSGANYIYPISQVGFQLARPAPNEQPRVVSVLIFNVK